MSNDGQSLPNDVYRLAKKDSYRGQISHLNERDDSGCLIKSGKAHFLRAAFMGAHLRRPLIYVGVAKRGKGVSSVCTDFLPQVTLENYYSNLIAQHIERKQRLAKLEESLKDEGLSEQQKQEKRLQHAQKETEFLRLKRSRLGVEDFEPLKVIGRGAFGEVRLWLYFIAPR